jgi:hypothetical protein
MNIINNTHNSVKICHSRPLKIKLILIRWDLQDDFM